MDPLEKFGNSQLLDFSLERLVVQGSIGFIKDFVLVNRRDFSFLGIEITRFLCKICKISRCPGCIAVDCLL
ncbi:MAG: hypothetical protein ACK55Z_12290, partial [bacterium]